MKKYKFDISTSQLEKFFPEERVKTKAQIIEILMETIRYISLNNSVPKEESSGTLVLNIDRMSRLFFFKEDKYFSIVFPFYTFEEDGKFNFSFQNKIDITSQLISKVISIIKCDEFKEKCSLDFVSPICEYEEQCDENFWIFLRELLLMEDGYLRYDYDLKEYEKAKKRGEENIHPLHHYDLFYSSNASFKIGLKKELLQDEFIDLLNTRTDCKYLTNTRNE
jgi:hypothetical protein